MLTYDTSRHCNDTYRILRYILRNISVLPHQLIYFVRTFDTLIRNNLYDLLNDGHFFNPTFLFAHFNCRCFLQIPILLPWCNASVWRRPNVVVTGALFQCYIFTVASNVMASTVPPYQQSEQHTVYQAKPALRLSTLHSGVDIEIEWWWFSCLSDRLSQRHNRNNKHNCNFVVPCFSLLSVAPYVRVRSVTESKR